MEKHFAANFSLKLRIALVLTVLLALLCLAGTSLANEWRKNDEGYWDYVDDAGSVISDYAPMGSITIPACVDRMNPDCFYNIDRYFMIYCEPGSYAEQFALKKGIQYDNGVDRVEGVQITNANQKAKWVVEHYTNDSMTNEEKALALHTWLLWNSEYDYTFSNYSASGVLVKGTGVCQSYAEAMRLMLTLAGVPNRLISGSANNNDGSGYQGHAWNQIQINGTWYHVDTTWGLFMLTDEQIGYDHHWSGRSNPTGFVQSGDTVRYYDANGQMVTGLQQITRTDYKFVWDESNKSYVDGDWEYVTTTKTYYFDENGILQKGLQYIGGKTYYFELEGDAATDKWLTLDGRTYYFGKDGSAQTGFFQAPGSNAVYYFLPDGTKLKNGWVEDGGYRYHIGGSYGIVETGRTDVDGDTYYFDRHGRMKTGLINGRYYGEDGKEVSGWQVIKGSTYYFGSYEHKWYNGGIAEIDGKKYCFDRSGKMIIGLWRDSYNRLYLFDSDGIMLTGWQTVDGARYYFSDYAATGFSSADAERWNEYYFDPDTCRLVTGLFKLPEGTSTISGKWFYAEPDGRITRGQWLNVDGRRMYASDDGYLYAGKSHIGNDTYFFDPNGVMQTGLVLLDGELYGFGEDGKQLSDVQVINGHTYCFRGSYYAALRDRWYGDDYYDAGGICREKEQQASGAHVHELELIPGKEPSCTETGLTDGYRCKICGEIVTPQTELPEKHELVTDPFEYAYDTRTGLTEGSHCKLCGKVLKPQEVIPMTSLTAGFVERCYHLILNRNPDADGIQDWTRNLEQGTKTAAEIIQGFLTSPEYQDQNKSAGETVEVLYRAMLDRPSDEAGKAGWTAFLDNGCSESIVINGFANSQEFTGLCENYGIVNGDVDSDQARDVNPSVTAFVKRCYTEAFGRNADAGGLNVWCGELLEKRQTPIQVAACFVFSPEMNAAQKIAENPDALLESLYKLYLGREADQAGKDFWKQQIAGGMTLDDLNSGFANSPEFSGIVAGYGLD